LTAGTELDRYFDLLMTINPPDEDLVTAISHTEINLLQASRRLSKMISGGVMNLRP
jgi:hypothetical protein